MTYSDAKQKLPTKEKSHYASQFCSRNGYTYLLLRARWSLVARRGKGAAQEWQAQAQQQQDNNDNNNYYHYCISSIVMLAAFDVAS